jgi:hypothetical protein
MAQSFIPDAIRRLAASNSQLAACRQAMRRRRQICCCAWRYDRHAARVSELADEMDLGSIALRAWGFESPLAHCRIEAFRPHSLSSDLGRPMCPGLRLLQLTRRRQWRGRTAPSSTRPPRPHRRSTHRAFVRSRLRVARWARRVPRVVGGAPRDGLGGRHAATPRPTRRASPDLSHPFRV